MLNGSCTDGIFQTINYHRAINKGETPEPVSSKVVAAPTQSLLQKWLREVHGIYVFVYMDEILWDSFRFNVLMNQQMGYDERTIMFDNYEEALEKGLFEALKLIKE